MKRPFLEQPEAWTRASRTGQTAVEAAYAIERQPHKRSVEPHELVLVILVASVTAAIVLGVM